MAGPHVLRRCVLGNYGASATIVMFQHTPVHYRKDKRTDKYDERKPVHPVYCNKVGPICRLVYQSLFQPTAKVTASFAGTLATSKTVRTLVGAACGGHQVARGVKTFLRRCYLRRQAYHSFHVVNRHIIARKKVPVELVVIFIKRQCAVERIANNPRMV